MKKGLLKLLPDLSERIKEAINFLKENEPKEGYSLCFSGGKDSLVCKHLLVLSKVKWNGFYTFPGIDPPEIVKYIRKEHPDIKIITAPSFYKYVKEKGPAMVMKRWCCDTQKKKPAWDSEGDYQVVGIRAEESKKRALRERINKFKNKIQYYPIFKWKEYEVWEFIEKYNLSYCKLYDDPSITRIGCIICPFQSYKEREKNKKKYPGHWLAYTKALKYFYYEKIPIVTKRKTQQDIDNFYEHYPTFEEFYEWIVIKNSWKPKKEKKKKGLLY